MQKFLHRFLSKMKTPIGLLETIFSEVSVDSVQFMVSSDSYSRSPFPRDLKIYDWRPRKDFSKEASLFSEKDGVLIILSRSQYQKSNASTKKISLPQEALWELLGEKPEPEISMIVQPKNWKRFDYEFRNGKLMVELQRACDRGFKLKVEDFEEWGKGYPRSTAAIRLLRDMFVLS